MADLTERIAAQYKARQIAKGSQVYKRAPKPGERGDGHAARALAGDPPTPPPSKTPPQPRPHMAGDPALDKRDIVGHNIGFEAPRPIHRSIRPWWGGAKRHAEATRGELEQGQREHQQRLGKTPAELRKTELLQHMSRKLPKIPMSPLPKQELHTPKPGYDRNYPSEKVPRVRFPDKTPAQIHATFVGSRDKDIPLSKK